MAIVQDSPQAVLNEINGLLDKQNIKAESISGDRLEDGTITSTQIADGTVGVTELSDALKRWLGFLGYENSATYLIGTGATTSANGWIRGGIGLDIYYDVASTTWINPNVGSNPWAAVTVDNAGNLAIFADPNSGAVQRTYTPAQFLAKQVATIDLANGSYENNVNNYRVRAQKLLTGGGTKVGALAFGVTWNQRFIAIAQGRGSTQAASGYFDITIPPDGTSVTGHGGAATRNWGSAIATFFAIGAWESLWYDLPLGSGATSQINNFHVVGYTSDFDIPDNWVCICKHNSDNGLVYWGDGTRQYNSINDNELLSPNNAVYRSFREGTATLGAAAPAATMWHFANTGVLTASGNAVAGGPQGVFYHKVADSAVNGLTNRFRVKAQIGCNNTAPLAAGKKLTVGLVPISAYGGGAGQISATLGAFVAGTTCVFTQPAANNGYESTTATAVVTTPSADFTLAAGLYCPAAQTDANTAANSFTAVTFELQMRHN